MGTTWFENQSLESNRMECLGAQEAFSNSRRQPEGGTAWHPGNAFPSSLLKPTHRSTADRSVEIIKESIDLFFLKKTHTKSKT